MPQYTIQVDLAIILQMYRIAKKGLLVIEGNDGFLIKVACKFGYSEEFERSAIKNNSGGVDNTNIPNFIIDGQKEIYKLICSFKPNINHKIFLSMKTILLIFLRIIIYLSI